MNPSPTYRLPIWLKSVISLIFLSTVLLWADGAEARRGFSRSFGRSMSSSMGRRGRSAFSLGSRRRNRSFGSSRGNYSRKGGVFARKSRRGQALGGAGGRARSSRRYSKYRSTRLGHQKLRKGRGATRATRAKTYYGSRTSRMRLNPMYYGGPMGWGYRSVGMWDLFFLSSVSRMFWYHHWQDPGIQRALYKDNMLQKEELVKLEQRVKELEAEGVPRDPKYLPEGVDPDIAYAKEYVETNRNEFYSDVDEPQESEGGFLGIFSFLFLCASIWYLLGVRRYA